jgi:hypothetical protein
MSPKYINIFFGSPVQVLNIYDALQEASIIPIIKDRAESARLAGFGSFSTDQEVWVHPEEEKRAKEILESLSL